MAWQGCILGDTGMEVATEQRPWGLRTVAWESQGTQHVGTRGNVTLQAWGRLTDAPMMMKMCVSD